MMVVVMVMMVVPLGKGRRSSQNRQEQGCGKNLFHKSHPSTASIRGR
jgi:hypothetical protein